MAESDLRRVLDVLDSEARGHGLLSPGTGAMNLPYASATTRARRRSLNTTS
jgi:hypothetical protein